MTRFLSRERCKAFTLLEMAIVLLMVGLMIGMVGQTRQVVQRDRCYEQTKAQLDVIRNAIVDFTVKNNRLPVPAGRALAGTHPFFARETNLPTEISNITSLPVGTDELLFGALPSASLGLSNEYATDCWGSKFTYVVTRALTTNNVIGGYPDLAKGGRLELYQGGPTGGTTLVSNQIAWAVISHGADHYGAVARNHTAGQGWCPPTAHGQDGENCDVTNNRLILAPYSAGLNPASSSIYFDDLMVYGGKPAAGTGGVTCSGSKLEWTSGANTCRADFPNTPDGMTVQKSNEEAYLTGIGTANCNNGTWGLATGTCQSIPVTGGYCCNATAGIKTMVHFADINDCATSSFNGPFNCEDSPGQFTGICDSSPCRGSCASGTPNPCPSVIPAPPAIVSWQLDNDVISCGGGDLVRIELANPPPCGVVAHIAPLYNVIASGGTPTAQPTRITFDATGRAEACFNSGFCAGTCQNPTGFEFFVYESCDP